MRWTLLAMFLTAAGQSDIMLPTVKNNIEEYSTCASAAITLTKFFKETLSVDAVAWCIPDMEHRSSDSKKK